METLGALFSNTFLTYASIVEQVIAAIILLFIILPASYKELKDPEVRKLGWIPYALTVTTLLMIITDIIPAWLQYLRLIGVFNNPGAIAFLSSLQKLLLPIIGIFFYGGFAMPVFLKKVGFIPVKFVRTILAKFSVKG
jgi:hypothetical protein